MTLINYQEIVAIQVLWYRDGMFNNKASDIYNKIYGTNLTFENVSDKDFKEKELLKESCSNRADYNLINEFNQYAKGHEEFNNDIKNIRDISKC
jgi:DNA sulfur modification protein DndC